MRSEVEKFCVKIGSDPLLVQGAGGNISWKEKDVLWVKASGKCMINAEKEDIFVPVNLCKIRNEIKAHNYTFNIQTLNTSKLRPSIETVLHGLMPHKVVLHIHAVEVLSYLVAENYSELLNDILNDFPCVTYVDYRRPGSDLACAISKVFMQSPDTQIIFLQNHGIVIGGSDVDEVNTNLDNLIKHIATHKDYINNSHKNFYAPLMIDGYSPVSDNEIHNLSLDKDYYNHVCKHWALCPDHVVFLGGKSFCYDGIESFLMSQETPDLLFIKNAGVYVSTSFTNSQLEQLKCYYNVVIRLNPKWKIATLSDEEINALINWDLEKYRVESQK